MSWLLDLGTINNRRIPLSDIWQAAQHGFWARIHGAGEVAMSVYPWTSVSCWWGEQHDTDSGHGYTEQVGW